MGAPIIPEVKITYVFADSWSYQIVRRGVPVFEKRCCFFKIVFYVGVNLLSNNPECDMG